MAGCGTCNYTGVVDRTCRACGGTGKNTGHVCGICGGARTVPAPCPVCNVNQRTRVEHKFHER